MIEWLAIGWIAGMVGGFALGVIYGRKDDLVRQEIAVRWALAKTPGELMLEEPVESMTEEELRQRYNLPDTAMN